MVGSIVVLAAWMTESRCFLVFCFFNDTATTEIYTLSLHDALPISRSPERIRIVSSTEGGSTVIGWRSEEHTSELQSRFGISYAVFFFKKKKNNYVTRAVHPTCTLIFSHDISRTL